MEFESALLQMQLQAERTFCQASVTRQDKARVQFKHDMPA